MTHPWNLIRGVCLYRPASPYLFEAVLASAKKAQRDLDRSWSAPGALIEAKLSIQKQIQELEWDQSAFSNQETRERERGREGERVILESLRHERRKRCDDLRAELAEIETELQALLLPIREARSRSRRLWVRRLMLASGDNREACLANLERLEFELASERIRGLQSKADARIEAAANDSLNAMRKSMGLKERAAETDDPWDWNRHRRRGGGGWNCA